MAIQERVPLGESGCYRRRGIIDVESVDETSWVIIEEDGHQLSQVEELMIPGFAGSVTVLPVSPIIADLSSDDHLECSECKGATLSFIALCARTFSLKYSKAIKNIPFINIRRFERWKVATKGCTDCTYSWDSVMARMKKTVDSSTQTKVETFDPANVYGDPGDFMSGRS